MLAKLVWLGATLSIFGLTVLGFSSQIRLAGSQISRLESDVPGVALLEVLLLLRSHWDTLAWALVLAAATSMISWVLLEAFVRGGMLPMTDQGFLDAAVTHFGTFLLAGLVRRIVFISVGVLVILGMMGPLLAFPTRQWVQLSADAWWLLATGLFLLSVVGFALMTLDTMLRSETLEYVRSDFASIIGIIGFVTFIEAVLVLATATTGIAFIRAGPQSTGLGVLLVGVVLTAASGIHSYLLLVRYFALGIMRREKREKRIRDGCTR